jgi:cell wall assembly regulator SMI1
MNMTQMTNLGPRLEEHEIEAFEKQIGYVLPGGYRTFLLTTNGGDPEDDAHFLVREVLRQPNVWTRVRFFYGLRRRDVGCWTLNETLELCGELLADDGLLPIATDDFGNQICLSLKGESGSVHFWIHDRDVPNERLAGSFEGFFESLRNWNEVKELNCG